MRWHTVFIIFIQLAFFTDTGAAQGQLQKIQQVRTQPELLLFLSRQAATDSLPAAISTTNYRGYSGIAYQSAVANGYLAKGKLKEGDSAYEKAIEAARDKDAGLAEGYLHFQLSRTLYEHRQTARGVEHLLYANELIDAASYRQIPGCGSMLAYMGSVYADYQDYATGLAYLHMALKYPFLNGNDKYYAYGTLGLVYYKLNQADSSIWASAQALAIATTLDKTAYGEMAGNLGVGFLLKKNYDSALYYLATDYRISSSLGNWPSANGALLMRTKILLEQGKMAAAAATLQKVDSSYRSCHCRTTLASMDYYTYLVKVSRLKGNYQQAVALQDSVDKFTRLAHDVNQAASLRSIELTTARKVSDARIALLESEKKRQLITRNLLIVLSGLIVIIFLQALYRNKQRQKSEKQVYELKLRSSEQQLHTYLQSIREKNHILDELTEELNRREQQNIPLAEDGTDWEILSRIKNSTLLTEQNWNEFVQLVNTVHPHFFVKLDHKMPGLTPSEIRLMTLIKLNLSNKEMGAMLGISADSVTKARQRVKKKLPLHGEMTLSVEEVVKMI